MPICAVYQGGLSLTVDKSDKEWYPIHMDIFNKRATDHIDFMDKLSERLRTTEILDSEDKVSSAVAYINAAEHFVFLTEDVLDWAGESGAEDLGEYGLILLGVAAQMQRVSTDLLNMPVVYNGGMTTLSDRLADEDDPYDYTEAAEKSAKAVMDLALIRSIITAMREDES